MLRLSWVVKWLVVRARERGDVMGCKQIRRAAVRADKRVLSRWCERERGANGFVVSACLSVEEGPRAQGRQGG